MIKKQAPQKKKLTPEQMRRYGIIAAIVLVVGLTGTNIWLVKKVKVEKVMAAKQQEKSVGEAAIGGDFAGVDHNGQAFSFAQTGGKLRLVFFGFTHCPMICPTSLATLSAVQDELGEAADKVTPVFVSVDPKRDTPEVVKSYISSFHPSMIGVTGDEAQMKEAAGAFKVFHSAGKKEADGSYNMDHSAYIYLMDGEGKYLKHFAYDAKAEAIVTAVQEYL